MAKTNAIRILESLGIEYDTFEYEYSEDELDGISVADKIKAEHDSVFKTLVARGDKKDIAVFCVPVSFDLNLKKAAAASGHKKVELISLKELFPLTGYKRGGCSPLGMKKDYPVYIDETSLLHDMIYLSAGIRGTQIKVNPEELKKAAGAEFADLT